MTSLSHLKTSCGTAIALSALFFAAGAAPASAAPSCMPKIEGPIPVTAASKIYEPFSDAYAGGKPPAGEKEEEFFVSCTVSGGAYKTVIHVTLPTDPARQSNVVITEPWHPQDFWTIYDKARNYITSAGHVSVVIVASNFILTNFIKKGNPERYASLTLPGPATGGAGAVGAVRPANAPRAPAGPPDTTQSEVLGQVGALIKSGGIPGVKARKAVLGGMSATGGVTRAYIQYEHQTPGAKSVYDGYFPEQAGGDPIMDLDVPVVEIQGERELIGAFERNGADYLRYRRPDGANYRLYEAPASPHIGTRVAYQAVGPQPTNRIEPGIADCTGHTWSDYPTDMLFDVALDNLVQWVDKGVAAPHVPWIDTSADGSIIHRDEFGNALGGLRMSYVDVPTNTYHANWGHYVTSSTGVQSDTQAAHCDLIGWINPLPAETIKRLYPTHADYVAKVDKDNADLVAKHWLLPADAARLHAEALAAKVP